MSQQRRDNWSRDTVRSLRRKIANLKAELKFQAMGSPHSRGRFNKMREQNAHLVARNRRLEASVLRLAEEVEWYRAQMETVVKHVDAYVEQPHRFGPPLNALSGIRRMVKHWIEHPLFLEPLAGTDDEGEGER